MIQLEITIIYIKSIYYDASPVRLIIINKYS